MSDLFREPDDATPLRPEEQAGLLQTWVTTRADLNEVEQANIQAAMDWLRRRRRGDLLTEAFLRQLHQRMFGQVWAWAGTFRRSERNLGVQTYLIPTEVEALLRDARYWIPHASYPPDEIALRFHHRLVLIHAFVNGNGRHARLVADLLVTELGGAPFSWGGDGLGSIGQLRERYIQALRLADAHDLTALLAFARS